VIKKQGRNPQIPSTKRPPAPRGSRGPNRDSAGVGLENPHPASLLEASLLSLSCDRPGQVAADLAQESFMKNVSHEDASPRQVLCRFSEHILVIEFEKIRHQFHFVCRGEEVELIINDPVGLSSAQFKFGDTIIGPKRARHKLLT